MEYDTNEKEYTLGEFYELYKDKLPTVIRVTEGFCGEILEETIEYGQVIRIHCILKQPRVIAVRLSDKGTEESTYSFPVNYPIQFCLEELYKNDTEALSLEEILDKRKLPVEVQFAIKHFKKSEGNTSAKSHFVTLRLTNNFDELYLLGNLIFYGELDHQIVRIPLHLYAIKLSEVIGLRGKSKSDWKDFQKKLDEKATQLNFDAVSGNPEIAKYKPNRSSRIASNDMEVDGFIYENLQLQTYTNIRELVGRIQSSDTETARANSRCIYEVVATGPAENKQDKEKGNKPIHEQKVEQKKDRSQLHLPPQALLGELTARFHKDHNRITKPDAKPKPPKISPKPKLNRNAPESSIPGRNTEEETSGKEVDDFTPPISPLPLSFPHSQLDNRKTFSTSLSDCYENMKIGRAEVHPMTWPKSDSLQGLSLSLHDQYTATYGQSKFQTSSLEQNEDGNDQETIDVKDFKVNELGRWMADKLRLGRYVARFADELVDGAILLDLDENLLKQEFGLSPVEAKRLMKFAREGHVPQ